VDLDVQAPGGDVVDEAADHGLRARRRDLGAEEHTRERLVAHPEHARVERLRIAARAADRDAAPAVGEALHAALEDAPADRVDDEVDPPAAGELTYPIDPVVPRVV